MSGLVPQVRRFMAAHGLQGVPGVVAVSGGADSVALLSALREAGSGPLAVGHINHQLRGPESDADETFVRDLARTFACDFRSLTLDVAARAETRKENLEATARQVRYEWLTAQALEIGAGWIATGHTADDQAETVLHRLLRGTGLQGLRGIAACRASVVKIVRPLLAITRAELLAYLESHEQPFRTDSSNADDRFTRNRIRHEALPVLKGFNPDLAAVLGTLAEQASEAFEVIEHAASQLLARAERPPACRLRIFDAGILAEAPTYLVREMFRLAWARENWPLGRMTAGHWHRLAGVALGDPPAANFPDGIAARRVGRVVQLERRE